MWPLGLWQAVVRLDPPIFPDKDRAVVLEDGVVVSGPIPTVDPVQQFSMTAVRALAMDE
ncbi:MAG: hypothetical protein UX17_C0005G0013 [Parcubacteria group bacterium GW2011_GWC2_45_7]|nr:MAG: hypothetical protein UX17_C0005G0013 [Parcubacteria group bacterium GW2011_GWC2_45_7]